MSSEEQKKFLRNKFKKGGVLYCALVNKKVCEDIGFITSNVELNSAIAEFAAKHGVTKVTVITGHNIMSCGDGPSADFDVKLQIG